MYDKLTLYWATNNSNMIMSPRLLYYYKRYAIFLISYSYLWLQVMEFDSYYITFGGTQYSTILVTI